MSQVIRVSDEIYRRLESMAEGFDTPNNVIQRLISIYEEGDSKPHKAVRNLTSVPADLEIVYFPAGEETFKRELLQHRRAYVKLHKTDGSTEIKSWDARKFTERSSVSGNLRSGFLRGWKKKCIFKAEISIDPKIIT